MITPDDSPFVIRSVPQLDHVKIDALIEQLEQAWALEEMLMKSVVGHDPFYLNPDSLRNPRIFYLGHSAVFYINSH